MNYTDEQLNAFLDNELSDKGMSELRFALQTDIDLAERLENISFVDALVNNQYSEIDKKPIPHSIVNLLSKNQSEPPITAFTSRVHSMFDNFIPKMAFSTVATTVTVLFFVVIGTQAFRADSPIIQSVELLSGVIDKGSKLHIALELTPSARLTDLDQTGDTIFTPVLTFLNKDNQYCREFSIQFINSTSRSVACKNNDQWDILYSSHDNSMTSNNDYLTASTATSKKFDRYIDQLITGDPFSSDVEIELIKNHWK